MRFYLISRRGLSLPVRVSGNATLSSRQRTQANPQSPLALARSLFDSMASAFSVCGIKIASMLCGKVRPAHLKNAPSRRLP